MLVELHETIDFFLSVLRPFVKDDKDNVRAAMANSGKSRSYVAARHTDETKANIRHARTHTRPAKRQR